MNGTPAPLAAGAPDGRPGTPPPASGVFAWLRLLRVPNLLTVPGDPWAGAVLAAMTRGPEASAAVLLLAGLSSLGLYAFGLILNDLCDLAEDRRERPHRPLASGAVGVPAAWAAAAGCAAVGLGCAVAVSRAAAVTAAILALVITAYNAGLKRTGWPGWLTMGACRGLSLALGAAFAGWNGTPLVVTVAAGTTLYIAAITCVSSRETLGWRRNGVFFLPPAAAALCLLTAWGVAGIGGATWRLGASAGLGAWLLWRGWRLARTVSARRTEPVAVQRFVGASIRGIILLQAGVLALGPGLTGPGLAALLVAVALPAASRLGRRFYGS